MKEEEKYRINQSGIINSLTKEKNHGLADFFDLFSYGLCVAYTIYKVSINTKSNEQKMFRNMQDNICREQLVYYISQCTGYTYNIQRFCAHKIPLYNNEWSSVLIFTICVQSIWKHP